MKVWEIVNKNNIGKKYTYDDKIYTVDYDCDNSYLGLVGSDGYMIPAFSWVLEADFEEITNDNGWYVDIKEDDKYYYIDSDGEIEDDYYSVCYTINRTHKDQYNTFATKEKAEEIAIEQLLYRKIKQFRDTEDERVDWGNIYKTGYYIYKDSNRNRYEVDFLSHLRPMHTIFFTTKKLAQRCLDEVVIPFLKENEII